METAPSGQNLSPMSDRTLATDSRPMTFLNSMSVRTRQIAMAAIGITAVSACALTAIVYGLMSAEHWNARFNPQADPQAAPGQTHWGTVLGISVALLIGAGVLMASLAFSFQRYFEYQIEEARKISQ